ncbi:PEP-CTERM sorting domain-containing protein [bacterium]|nr:PEP-CTERM sorting domain-containing protein [bacterium]
MVRLRSPRGKALGLLLSAAMSALSMATPSIASPIYGELSNFDIINDTGQTAHGFEIELDGCDSSQVYSTFGAPYNRYGDPTITTVGGNTFIRYQSAYSNGSWAVGTDSGPYGPTGGHSLYNPTYGGDPAYPNVPGDHFGVSLGVVPTNTIYHWLLDDGSGNLVLAGTSVKVPAPVLNVVAPANPVNPVAVQAVIQAPAPEDGQQLSDAIWVKVFTTVVENAGPVELEQLVVGNAVVPPETETEIEWVLLQTDPNRPDLAEKIDEGDVAQGNESITRRYEFYEYIGGYDPENHEVLNDSYDPSFVGAYLGNQNVAVNLVQVPEVSTFILCGVSAIGLLIAGYRRGVQR